MDFGTWFACTKKQRRRSSAMRNKKNKVKTNNIKLNK